MPTILSIDTTTNACSCALSIDGNISERFDVIPRQHANRLLPMIHALLSEHRISFNKLDAVAYGQGPGSFTGLRIAAGVTQGIAFGSGLPVIPVSSLASLAFQAGSGSELVFASLDAKIDEVYWGFYRVDEFGVVLDGTEGLCKPEQLPNTLPGDAESLAGVGSGLSFIERMPSVYRERLTLNLADCYPRASAIARLAQDYYELGLFQQPEEVNPVYLRDKVTHN